MVTHGGKCLCSPVALINDRTSWAPSPGHAALIVFVERLWGLLSRDSESRWWLTCVGTTRADFEVSRATRCNQLERSQLIWPLLLNHEGQVGFTLQGLPDSDLTLLQKGKGQQLSKELAEMEAERNLEQTMVTNLFSKVWCQPSYSGR